MTKPIYGLQLPRAKKSLGQHFLTDNSVVEALIHMLDAPSSATVVEVGPGPGILTRALAECCHTLHAIEVDREMIKYLNLNCTAENLFVHNADILKTDLLQFLPDKVGEKLYIASNLPYQISSPFLFGLVDHLDHIANVALMMQKEVIDRITATPGSSDYGRLSVMMQFFFDAERGQDVPASAFSPPPAVTSALVKLKPRSLSSVEQQLASTLSDVVKLAFSARRKTLRNTLRPAFEPEALTALDIDPAARPQTLPVAAFLRLAQAAFKRGGLNPVNTKH